jgi:2,3-dihydroxybenzoate decarboxylase
METIYDKRQWLMGATCQFHVQLTIHIQALCQGGVFDRYPGAKIIVGHLGENIVRLFFCAVSLIRAYAHCARRFTCPQMGENEGFPNGKDVRLLFPQCTTLERFSNE